MKLPAVSAALACLTLTGSAIAGPIRIVILSGANVHDWKATTPFLENMYGDSERFKVVRTVDDVSKVTAADFADADVIVSNWTCHPIMTGGPWTAEGKQAFADAIRGGKGLVSFHAACAACNDWPEFQEICGLTWKLDHTSHTSYHTFKVVITDKKHAITRGLPDFWITDELYQRMVKLTPSDFQIQAQAFANTTVNGTGAWEPMLITTRLGKGRGVNLLLGHDVQAMRNIAWQTLMLRATEWAATGKVTIRMPHSWPTTPAAAAIVGTNADEVIAASARYAYGQAREPLFLVEQWVNDATSRMGRDADAHRAELAAKIAAAMPRANTAEARSFLCRQLAMIGTAEQVPAIAPLLRDETTAMMARFALERIAGPTAGAALRDALPGPPGKLRVGVINSIGQRAEAYSVLSLAPFLRDPDPTTATAAASALGRIGTVEAAGMIKQVLLESEEPLRSVFVDAYLMCGERLLSAGKKGDAAGVYKLLYAPAETPFIRAAALRGLLRSQPTQANSLIPEAFDSGVSELITAVADLVREPSKVGDPRLIAAAAMRLPPDSQVKMIAALADRGDKAAASIRRGADSESPAVRLAVIDAVVRLGDESDVGWLIDRATRGCEAERTAVMSALRRMPTPAAQQALADLVHNVESATTRPGSHR